MFDINRLVNIKIQFPSIHLRRARFRNNDINSLVQRWLSVFEYHAVKRHQIPLVLGKYSPPQSKLDDESALADYLTDGLRDHTCQLFNIYRPWLEGERGPIYDTVLLDRSIDSFLDVLMHLMQGGRQPEIIAIRSADVELEEQWYQAGALLLRVPIKDLAHRTVFQYLPIFTLRDWGNAKQRHLAIRAMLAAYELGIRFWGAFLKESAIDGIAEGTVFVESVLPDLHPKVWHPTDYLCGSESPHAKGLDILRRAKSSAEQDGTLRLVELAKSQTA